MSNIGRPIILSVIVMHVSNISLIFSKKNLHNARYYLLANLSFSDVLLALIVLIQSFLSGNSEEHMDLIAHICLYSSLISTVLISLDRYIAIVWCLRYKEIVTNKNVAIISITSWCVSLAVTLLPTIEYAQIWKGNFHYRSGSQIYRSVVAFSCCIALVFLSIILLRIRRNHIKAIALRKSDFPNKKEKLDILHGLKESAKCVFRLNIATVTILVILNAASLCYEYNVIKSNVVGKICSVIYLFSNPVLYALIMTEMRMHYYKGVKTYCCCCIKQNRIVDINVMAANRENQCADDVKKTTRNRVSEVQ